MWLRLESVLLTARWPTPHSILKLGNELTTIRNFSSSLNPGVTGSADVPSWGLAVAVKLRSCEAVTARDAALQVVERTMVKRCTAMGGIRAARDCALGFPGLERGEVTIILCRIF
jgi:hypothetical protein